MSAEPDQAGRERRLRERRHRTRLASPLDAALDIAEDLIEQGRDEDAISVVDKINDALTERVLDGWLGRPR